jgi:hypothetical protein
MPIAGKFAVALMSISVVGALAGCASQNVGHSGFLQNYAQLKPDPKVDGALRYLNPTKNLKQYDRFIIDPIAVYFAPGAKGAGIDPAKLKELTDYFRSEIVKELTKNYRVVSAPGKGVMLLRIAITDVEESEPLLNIHPAMKLTGAGLGGASMEAEGIDSLTGQRIGAIVETRSGDRMSLAPGLSRLGHAKQVIRYWVERFLKNLNKAHGYKS